MSTVLKLSNPERDYHLRRQRECERMALEAQNPAAKTAHEILAAEHARLAEGAR